jgi:hypothetical protein
MVVMIEGMIVSLIMINNLTRLPQTSRGRNGGKGRSAGRWLTYAGDRDPDGAGRGGAPSAEARGPDGRGGHRAGAGGGGR